MAQHGLRLNLPYLNGVYVAVSAIADARLVIDGPFCITFKAELHSAHDPTSTLVSPTELPRLVHSDIQFDSNVVFKAAVDRGEDIVDVLSRMSTTPDTGIVLITSMDLYEVAATPLERYARAAQTDGGAPLVVLESRSLEDDWLSGYARAVDRIAEAIPLPDPDPAPDRVAIVGHLMDRNEGDQRGNLAEYRRLLEALGLDIVSIWLDGGSVADLQAVQRAGTIIGLPYARTAARRLADRLSIACVELDLPIGLDGTARFIRAIGNATDRAAQAETVVAHELHRVVPRIRNLAFRFLTGRNAVLAVDPHIAQALPPALRELGVDTVSLSVQGGAGSLSEQDTAALDALDAALEPLVDLHERGPRGLQLDRDFDADFVIATTLLPHDPMRATWVPFGYPNYMTHPTAARPFLGFDGLWYWVDSLVEAAQRTDVRNSTTPLGGTAARVDDTEEREGD